MADWQELPTNYKDARWNGNRKYRQIPNSDGTVSFADETEYTERESSFFSASDANQINDAVNTIMRMLKDDPNQVYEKFAEYFDGQKAAFEKEAEQIEASQSAAFDAWFEQIKGQLSEDAAGHLQNQMVDLYSAVQETKEIDIVVPVSAWKVSGSSEVSATVSVPAAKQNGQVAMAWVEENTDDAFSVARIADLSEVCYTGEGEITFYAARVPTKEIQFHVCLLRTGDVPKRLLFRKEEKGLLFDYYSDGDIRPAGEMTPDPSIVTFENVTVADNADVSLDSRGNSKLTMQVAFISGGSKAVEMKWTGNDTTTGFPAVRIRLNAPTTELALGLAINCRRSRNMALTLNLYAVGQSLGTLVKDYGSYSFTPPNDGVTHHIRIPLTSFGIKDKITLPETATHLCLRISWSNPQTTDAANDRVWIDNVGFFDFNFTPSGGEALPIATETQLGGVKLGDSISGTDDGTININTTVVASDLAASEEDIREMLDEVLKEE